jgi:hypothetical protein
MSHSRALCAVSAFMLLCSLFTSSHAVPATILVPLTMNEPAAFKVGSPKFVTYSIFSDTKCQMLSTDPAIPQANPFVLNVGDCKQFDAGRWLKFTSCDPFGNSANSFYSDSTCTTQVSGPGGAIEAASSTGTCLNRNLVTCDITRSFTAVPQVTDLFLANGMTPSATFSTTFSPSNQAITFGNIAIANLSSPLSVVHIHGPCEAEGDPCNADVVYTICGGAAASACPSGTSPTIPSFVVDINQVNNAFASAVGLYQSIMQSNRLYYLNFHTQQ